MTFPAGARLVAYLRDSGGKDQELSLDQQEAAIRTWCAKHGYTLTALFKDEGISGESTVGRQQFNAMMQHFRSADCTDQGLVLWKYNRFARDFDDAQFFKADLRRRNYIIHSMNDTVPEGSDGRLFEAAIDWMNQRYREDLAADVRRGLHFVVRTYGAFPVHKAPLGFQRQRFQIGTRRDGSEHHAHRLVVDPQTAPLVQRAFALRAAGATIAQIDAEFHFYKVTSSYTKMFTKRIYMGDLEYGVRGVQQTVLEKYVEPLIDPQTWEKCQELHRRFRRIQSGKDHPRRRGSSFLLSGILYCDICGGPMSGRSYNAWNKKRYRYYCCQSLHSRPNYKHCSMGMLPEKILDEAVLANLIDFILLPSNLQRLVAQVKKAGKTQAAAKSHRVLKQDSAAVDRQIANLVDAIAASGHNTSLLARLADLETQKSELEIRIIQSAKPLARSELLIEDVADIANVLKAKLQESPSKNRFILQGLIKSIRLQRQSKRITGVIEYYLPRKEFISTLSHSPEE